MHVTHHLHHELRAGPAASGSKLMHGINYTLSPKIFSLTLDGFSDKNTNVSFLIF